MIKPVLMPSLILIFAHLTIYSCLSRTSSSTPAAPQPQPIQQQLPPPSSAKSYINGEIKLKLPPGNLNTEISWATLYANLPSTTKQEFSRFSNNPNELKQALDIKYRQTLRTLARDSQTLSEIKLAARAFDIDPVLILGNIIAEHTYNVGLTDSIQNLLLLSVSWGAKWALRFKANEISLEELLKKSQFHHCRSFLETSHADYWDCVAWVWNTKFRNKTVDGVAYQNSGFRLTFFNPISAGFTYGLGQMDPIRALMATDLVHNKSGHRLLSIEKPEEIYVDIINPHIVVHYVAANIQLALEAYYQISHMDISSNPGVVASLYNLGQEKALARKRYEINVNRINQGLPLELAKESFYGFFVNEKESELRKFINLNTSQLSEVALTGIIP